LLIKREQYLIKYCSENDNHEEDEVHLAVVPSL